MYYRQNWTNTSYHQPTRLNRPIITSFQYILSTYLSIRLTLTLSPLLTSSQPSFPFIHLQSRVPSPNNPNFLDRLIIPPYLFPLNTPSHPINTYSTHSINPLYQPTISTHQ